MPGPAIPRSALRIAAVGRDTGILEITVARNTDLMVLETFGRFDVRSNRWSQPLEMLDCATGRLGGSVLRSSYFRTYPEPMIKQK